MASRFPVISKPLLLAGVAVLGVVVVVAAAFAIGDDDEGPDTVKASPSVPAATETATPEPASATPISSTTTPPAAETWIIEFQRTGGFAGLSERLSISSDGKATYEDLRRGRVVQGDMDAAALGELKALIEDSDFFSQTTPQEAPCADCFNLSISVTFNGRAHTVEAVDIGLDATLRPLVERLSVLLQEGLRP